MKIPTEDFTDVTLVICDTYGDDVSGGNGGDGHGGWQGSWHGIDESYEIKTFLMGLWQLVIFMEMMWELDMEVDKVMQSSG